jgi:hypothetical protein
MKRLFTDDERETYTKDALLIDQQSSKALKSIVDRCVKRGYSIRDLSYILHACVSDVCLDALLDMKQPLKTATISPPEIGDHVTPYDLSARKPTKYSRGPISKREFS